MIKRNENGIWMDHYHKPTDIKRSLLLNPITQTNVNETTYLAQRICMITKNNGEQLKNLENLKSNLSKYYYPGSLTKERFRKALSTPQKDLQKLKITK